MSETTGSAPAAPDERRARTPRLLAWLRGRFRASESWFIALAILVGVIAGALAAWQGAIAHWLQVQLYGFDETDRLSAVGQVSGWRLLWLPVGGALLGLSFWALSRWRPRALVDVVEANTLYGGRVSFRDSLIVCAQTLISNGFGGSVGLEAAYAQAGGAAASTFGQRFNLRRQDLRTLVGAGAGAAIGAAFGAPLTGAFYAFEVVIGSYAPSMIAPVAAASLAGVLAAQAVGGVPYALHVPTGEPPEALDYLLYGGLGALCAGASMLIMQLVALLERLLRRVNPPAWLRPMAGGVLLIGLAALSTQTLSAGHGALVADLAAGLSIGALLWIFLLKVTASVISLGFGFRGGLFFASLFLGSLLGQAYAQALAMTGVIEPLQVQNAGLVGMGAMAAAIVGGPLTMSFLVLESTRNFGVAAAALAASLVAGSIMRERFGYSFSTWRLHLRGETIRSVRDVGWVRALTAGRMMRTGAPTIAETATLAEFRRRFPLGSTSRVVAVDDAQRYAGVVQTADAFAESASPQDPVSSIVRAREVSLPPEANIEQVMARFDAAQTEELAVVGPDRQVLGLLAETYVTRRYARELEKIQQGLFGEDVGR